MKNPGALTSRVRLHVGAATAVAAILLPALAAFLVLTRRIPSRGYTPLGLALGSLAALSALVGLAYVLRKRRLQERLPGRLSTWLIVHAWVTSAGFAAALVHAGFHFDGQIGTWTLAVMGVAVVSGLFGLAAYVSVPPRVAAGVGNLAMATVDAEIASLRNQMEEASAGRSDAFKRAVERALAGERVTAHVDGLPATESVHWAGVVELAARRVAFVARRAEQERLSRRLRTWLLVHVPASLLFVVLLAAHAVDASGLVESLRPPAPERFPSPEECASCHPRQFAEWSGSMHAMAISSPVTELQNLAVVMKERGAIPSGPAPVTPVGSFCVDCHAPLTQGGGTERADPLLELGRRAPSTRFGVSCAACHQLSALHPDDSSADRPLRNARNLEYRHGRTMYGPFGRPGGDELPSVGNSRHRGEPWPFAGEDPSLLCASCHTVTIDQHSSGTPVVLQDTYRQWGSGPWKERGVTCLDCHGKDLASVAQVARQLAADREPLASRAEPILEALRAVEIPEGEREAASPPDDFDLPLPPRRRFEHLFVGVDYPLEADLPFPGQAETNAALKREHLRRVSDLMTAAAAVRITAADDDAITVDIMNLLTGHPLPAGFAFAREIWLELAIDPSGGDDFDGNIVIGGGPDGAPLRPDEPLDKQQPGLRNFQAVLWNGEPGVETQLQNEVREVLAGQRARENGFPDREAALQPDEIRSLCLPLAAPLGAAAHIRVRLLHRNLPPEFLTGLAARLDEAGDNAGDGVLAARCHEGATRCRALIASLEIIEMASDTVVAGDLPRASCAPER